VETRLSEQGAPRLRVLAVEQDPVRTLRPRHSNYGSAAAGGDEAVEQRLEDGTAGNAVRDDRRQIGVGDAEAEAGFGLPEHRAVHGRVREREHRRLGRQAAAVESVGEEAWTARLSMPEAVPEGG
jgi:hypothetical protein